ncbi:flagellar protein FliT [Vibrio sp.]|uniref:flagellar protein FliT n=1 Tax=Vibrio sp. TaxID=678 RepID=UPI003D12955E
MHLDNGFREQLAQLGELNRTISNQLSQNELDTAEIAQCVDNREQILQLLLGSVRQHPELADSEQWQKAVEETRYIAQAMVSKTSELGQQLKKYRHGSKSIQQYKKFL